MEITGKIIAVLPERGGISKTGNEWKMQEYVIETHEQYPRKVCFNVFGSDKIAQFYYAILYLVLSLRNKRVRARAVCIS